MSESRRGSESFRGVGDADAEEQRYRVAPQGSAIAGFENGNGGGCLSNTHLQASQVVELVGFPGCTFAGGLDWLAWSASVIWEPSQLKALLALIEAAKKMCQEQKLPFQWVELPGIEPIRVWRMGLNRGGDSGQHFEFKLSYRGIAIGLAKTERGTNRRPNMFARLTGRDCLLLGAKEGYQFVCELIARLGGLIEYEKVARVDFCLDVAEMHVRKLQEVAECEQFITLAKHVQPFVNLVGDQRTGLSVGKSPVRMIAYDKRTQLIDGADSLYLQAVVDRRWNGILPNAATRIEFQLSRQWLSQHGISSVNDVFNADGAIVGYLSEIWFRLTDAPVDRKNNNQARAATLPLWAAIQQAFLEVFGKSQCDLRTIRRSEVNPAKLIIQGRGCLASAMRQMGLAVNSMNDFVFHTAGMLYKSFAEREDEEAFLEDYRRLSTEYGQ